MRFLACDEGPGLGSITENNDAAAVHHLPSGNHSGTGWDGGQSHYTSPRSENAKIMEYDLGNLLRHGDKQLIIYGDGLPRLP